MRMAMASGIFGLTEIMSGAPHGLTVETLAPTELEYIPREAFAALLLEHTQLAANLLKYVSKEFKQMQSELCAAADGVPLSERLLSRFRELAALHGEPVAGGKLLRLSLTVQDIADNLGCSRQWASKLLVDIENKGLIARRGRRLIVSNIVLSGHYSGG